MKKSILFGVAASVLLAGSLLTGAAHAQFTTPPGTTTTTTTIITTDPGVSVGTPVGAPGVLTAPPGDTLASVPAGAAIPSGGIGSGMRGGVGAPIGGLDSNPYAEAPQAARALGYPYHPPGATGAPPSTE